ncbi:hypothetical protein AHAS_Ahas01G0094300 [Arachis hypogaea]
MENTEYSNEIKCLACGPRLQARRYGPYNVNGYKFRTMAKDEGMKSQNSGVYVSFNTRSYASMHDQKVAIGSVPYYGKILCCSSVFERIRLLLEESNKIIWVLLVLTSLVQYTLAHPVCYVDDEVDKQWSVVVHVKPRDLYDMGEENEEAEVGFSPQPRLNMSTIENIGELQLARDDDTEDPTDNVSENIDDVA